MQFGVNHLGEIWAESGFSVGSHPIWVVGSCSILLKFINISVCPIVWVSLDFFPLLLLKINF